MDLTAMKSARVELDLKEILGCFTCLGDHSPVHVHKDMWTSTNEFNSNHTFFTLDIRKVHNYPFGVKVFLHRE